MIRTSSSSSACSATRCFRRPAAEDLLPFPRYANQQPIVFDFSHAKHVDPQARVDPRTGFRADCTFCHHFNASGAYASFGNHVICASCHSKAGMKPLLSDKSTKADCQGCHQPEEIENPSAVTIRPPTGLVRSFREVRAHKVFTRPAFEGTRGVSSRLHDLPLCGSCEHQPFHPDAADHGRLRELP